MDHISKAVLLLAGMFLWFMPDCGKTAQLSSERETASASYRAVPGVTEEEIAAIEKLRAQRVHLIYGMRLSTEAYHDQNGDIQGFSRLFCDWLTDLFGMPFVPAVYEWQDLLAGLRTGTIDFTGELSPWPERRRHYIMTEAIAERPIRCMSLAGSDYSAGIALLRRPRYAFLHGTAIRDQIAVSSAEPFETVFVDGYAQAYRALVNGEADAFFDEGLADAPFAGYGNVVAMNYSPHIYSPVSLATQNEALAPVIAVVQKAIHAGAARQIVRLYNEGREDYLSHELYEEFSKEERDFVRARSAPGRAIRLAAEHDNYPISFYNDREDAWQGIAFNVLEEVGELTGLTFSVAHSEPLAWTELLRMLENGEAEMVTELIRSPEREGHFLWSDNAYQTDHYALLSRFEHEDIGINEILYSRVGLIKATAYAEAFRTWFPHHPNTVEYESTEEAFNALDRGDVELVMATRNLVLRMTNFRERPDFKANVVFEHTYASLYGFSPGGELLKSVVSKAMRHIRTQDITERWTRRVFDYRGKMAREQRLWLGGVSGLMLCVLVLLFIVLQRRKKEERRLETTVRERTKELVRQDELLHVINGAAAVLLASDDGEFETSLRRGLEMMARSVDADRAYIWRNSGETDAAYTQAFEWRDMDVRPRTDTGEIVEFSYLESIPEWKTRLAAGQCVNGTLRSLSQTEQERLAPYGIQSLLVVPVFSRNQFWGFVSFDDCRNERDFSPDEESILRSGSLMLANALIRHETMQSLVSAREEAISSTRAKSNFLSNMSHEMRTPMNAIIGMAAIGKTGSDLEKKNYAFGRIEIASSHLLGVINDILDMSKIEANKFELSFAEFDFEKMLRKVADVISFRVEEKQQDFSIRIDGNIPGLLVGDDQRLAQVITNLLSNAVKFTPERGSVRLDASLLKEEDGICTIRIEVADTGIGISPDQQDRLFKSFQQADNSISRKFGGTGLGLAISKQIVDMMGGTIWITSQMGQGATFTFTIQAERVRQDAARAPAGSPTAWSGLRALAVSEAPEIRRYFESAALQYGFHCDTADGGGNACGRLKQHASYDICFIDWDLAGMDALELAGRIREYCAGCFIAAIVAMSRWNAAESDARGAGVDAFLTKPLFPSSLADCLNACLGADSSRATADAQPGVPDLRGYCLLLVEDVEINQEIVVSLLEPTSLAIECAPNGVEAVRMFSAHPDRYDMIFMDIQMPEMDGYEATRRIRALAAARAKEVPIVAMTANVFREDIEKCLEAGMNDHIGKPLDLKEVFDKLRRYLPRRAAGDPDDSLSG